LAKAKKVERTPGVWIEVNGECVYWCRDRAAAETVIATWRARGNYQSHGGMQSAITARTKIVIADE
jgi:hypothetical protein